MADISTVDVPEIQLEPTMENGIAELHQDIDPLRESDFHGIDIYVETLQYIWNRI